MAQSTSILTALFCVLMVQVTLSVPAPNTLQNGPPEASFRIINGTLAKSENTMHQVSIRRRSDDSLFFGAGHICGGSLITPSAVLSAAHCFPDPNSEDTKYLPKEDFVVVLGILTRTVRDNNTLVFDIARIEYGTPNFNRSTYDKDIALIFLNGSVPSDHPTAKPIHIARTMAAAGTVCQASGWGLNEEDDNPIKLMSIDLPILPERVCKNETALDTPLTEGMFCAGHLSGGRDTCTGDSGGPLVCDGKLTGVISWSNGCALAMTPGVYTNVAFYANWIENHLTQAGLTPTTESTLLPSSQL